MFFVLWAFGLQGTLRNTIYRCTFWVLSAKKEHVTTPSYTIVSFLGSSVYQVVPSTRRGGSFERKILYHIGRRWHIGKFLRCRSNEVLKLWRSSSNEQMVVEMPMKGHERIHAQLTEWISEPMNRWTNEPMNRWFSESMKDRSDESMTQKMNQ